MYATSMYVWDECVGGSDLKKVASGKKRFLGSRGVL